MRRPWLVPVVVAGVVVAFDQFTKEWALRVLDDRTVDVVGSLRLRLVFNTGSAFSLASGFGPLLAVVGVVVVVVLLGTVRSVEGLAGEVALGLVVGGAVGNLVDRSCGLTAGWRAGPWSTSSTSSGGRCSTSPTWPSRLGRCCWRSPSGGPTTRRRLGRPRSASTAVKLAEVVPPALDGERVDRVVALLTGLPRSEVSQLVEVGAVRLRGDTVTTRSTRVASGDTVEVDVAEAATPPPMEGGGDEVALDVVSPTTT